MRRVRSFASIGPFLLNSRFFSSIVDRISSAVTRRVSDITETHMMPLTEQRITEKRRPYPRRPSMPENLKERLFMQQHLRARLVPSQVVVSKDKLYLDLVWPDSAVDAAEKHQGTFTTKTASAATETNRMENNKKDSNPIPTPSTFVSTSSSTRAYAAAGNTHIEHTPLPNAEKVKVPKPVTHRINAHRTRLLAEFLRAHSPSTDVIGADALIYGRRGITVTDVYPVGNYALRIVFSDGHSGGVFPYEYLFHLGTQKYTLMREYIRRLRDNRKSRDPPRRAPSQQLRALQNRAAKKATNNAHCAPKQPSSEGKMI